MENVCVVLGLAVHLKGKFESGVVNQRDENQVQRDENQVQLILMCLLLCIMIKEIPEDLRKSIVDTHQG